MRFAIIIEHIDRKKDMKALILHASGTNRDLDAQYALQVAGMESDVVHINKLKSKEKKWQDYALLVIPGGFSYGDSLGAGLILALELMHYFFDELNEFLYRKKPIIGICNGFQVLVRAGLLPSLDGALNGLGKDSYKNRTSTLTKNKNGKFECRDVILKVLDSKCIWTKGIKEPIICPVAHGEGRFFSSSKQTIDKLVLNKEIVLKYARPNADKNACDSILVADGAYPYNPNGSILDIAGLCDSTGLILGLMPHTENNIARYAFFSKERERATLANLAIWKNGVYYAKNS